MRYGARDAARVRTPVLLVSGLAWVALLATSHESGVSATAMAAGSSHSGLHAMTSPSGFAAHWLLMLVAMMAPVLIHPIRHVWRSSLARRRARATVLFVVAYFAVWMMAGALVLGMGIMATRVAAPSLLIAAAGLIVAAIWQASPVKQRFLNRCHARPVLAAFGGAADRGTLWFGVSHGAACLGSCWVLMALVSVIPTGHVVAMVAATLLIAGERIERPRRPSWEWRGLGTVTRLAIVRVRA